MMDQLKLEAVKKLECLVAFQKDCLSSGNWEDYDRLENEIKKLEEEITENCGFDS